MSYELEDLKKVSEEILRKEPNFEPHTAHSRERDRMVHSILPCVQREDPQGFYSGNMCP